MCPVLVMSMTDTVGFVSALPHALVQAFRATLEEVSLGFTAAHC